MNRTTPAQLNAIIQLFRQSMPETQENHMPLAQQSILLEEFLDHQSTADEREHLRQFYKKYFVELERDIPDGAQDLVLHYIVTDASDWWIEGTWNGQTLKVCFHDKYWTETAVYINDTLLHTRKIGI